MEKWEPVVSVIIPTYNREKTIGLSIESVLNQTYKNIEIIVVDDASLDDTETLVKKYQKWIKYFKYDENKGANYARNFGVDHSSGELISFLDSDNIWDKDKLKCQIECLQNTNADVVCCRYRKYEDFKRIKNNVDNSESGFYDINHLLINPVFDTSCLLGYTEIFKRVKFDITFPRLQDYDLTINILHNGYTIYLMQEELVDSYIQSDSISKNDTKLIDAETKLINKYKELFNNNREAYAIHLNRIIIAKALLGENCTSECIQLNKVSPSFNAKIKIIISRTRILKNYYKKFHK